jgi:hypothetical protein
MSRSKVSTITQSRKTLTNIQEACAQNKVTENGLKETEIQNWKSMEFEREKSAILFDMSRCSVGDVNEENHAAGKACVAERGRQVMTSLTGLH